MTREGHRCVTSAPSQLQFSPRPSGQNNLSLWVVFVFQASCFILAEDAEGKRKMCSWEGKNQYPTGSPNPCSFSCVWCQVVERKFRQVSARLPFPTGSVKHPSEVLALEGKRSKLVKVLFSTEVLKGSQRASKARRLGESFCSFPGERRGEGRVMLSRRQEARS